MLLFGKTAVPEIGHFIPSRATFEQIIQTPTLLLVAPAGTLIVESLATVLIHSGRRVLWLRAGPEDRDPAQFLLGLIGAAQQVVPTAGSMTRELMRRQPGPIKGWAGLFAELAQELLAQLPPECTLVIEHAELLDDPAPTLQLLSSQILPVLSSSCACVLIADYDLPRSLLPERVLRCSAQALQLTLADLQGLADHGASGLSHATMQRALALLQGHADALFSFCRIASRLGPQTTSQLVLSARNAEQLLVSAARAGLRLEQPATRQSLDLSLRLPGLHPDLLAAIGQPALPDLAWLVPLQNQWVRLRSVWQALLPRSLRESEQAPEGMLLRLADCLVQQDALVLAVPLLLGLEQHEHAAALISDALEDLMGLGQWETLQGWLDQLPRATLHNWPWLVYAQGEMAAAQHDLDLARRSFAMASNLFTARRELEGLCQSLLAEGTLALWQGEPLLAQTRVLSAYGHAESAGMAWQHGWAAWQLFCLAMADGDSDSALIYLDRALGAALEVGEPVLTELLRMVEELLVQRRDLLHQRVLHEQAVRSYEQAERLVSERLRDLVVLQPAQSELLVANHPWSDIPLLLKLSAPQQRLSTAPPETLWQSFLRVLGLRRQLLQPRVEAAVAEPATEERLFEPLFAVSETLPLTTLATFDAPGEQHPASLPGAATTQLVRFTEAARYARTVEQVQPLLEQAEVGAPLTLSAHMLGPFRVSLNENPIDSWPGGRGRSVLKYLLVHRERPIARDVLMDLFWTESRPEDARNSLHVAMHRLRQTLRSAADVPVVIFQRKDASYLLNPDLAIWLDVEEFEHHVQAGRQHEALGHFAAAVASYEQATSLYQGDFMEDDPYEEWSVLQREQLRLAYLETLERLGQIYFSQGQYAACTNLCQLILARDNCREDAHCRLMRCYSRQGQHHLALRQYQSCVRALKTDLGVDPAPATMQLAERIRRREYV